MPPGALIIHLFSIQMPPGAGGGGETAEGASGPLFPAGMWRGSSGPPRRLGSTEESEREASHSHSSPGCRLTGTHSPSTLGAHVGIAGWGLINLVSHEGNICRGARRKGGASFLPGWSQSARVQAPSLAHLSWAILATLCPHSGLEGFIPHFLLTLSISIWNTRTISVFPHQNARCLKLCRKVALSTHVSPDSSLGPESLQSRVLRSVPSTLMQHAVHAHPLWGWTEGDTTDFGGDPGSGSAREAVLPGGNGGQRPSSAPHTQPTGKQAHYMTNCRWALNSGNQAHL